MQLFRLADTVQLFGRSLETRTSIDREFALRHGELAAMAGARRGWSASHGTAIQYRPICMLE